MIGPNDLTSIMFDADYSGTAEKVAHVLEINQTCELLLHIYASYFCQSKREASSWKPSKTAAG